MLQPGNAMPDQELETAPSVVAVDQFTVVWGKKPAWGDADHSYIGLTILFEGLRESLGAVFFCAREDDPEAHGKEIYTRALAGEFGKVAEYAEPIFSSPELEAAAREWRDAELSQSQWLVERHRDQLEEAVVTTLTAEQYAALLSYRRDLRDWPSLGSFPAEPSRPKRPEWLLEVEGDNDSGR